MVKKRSIPDNLDAVDAALSTTTGDVEKDVAAPDDPEKDVAEPGRQATLAECNRQMLESWKKT